MKSWCKKMPKKAKRSLACRESRCRVLDKLQSGKQKHANTTADLIKKGQGKYVFFIFRKGKIKEL